MRFVLKFVLVVSTDKSRFLEAKNKMNGTNNGTETNGKQIKAALLFPDGVELGSSLCLIV